MKENIIVNVKAGTIVDCLKGFELARDIANKSELETGNKTTVRRILDYVDQYNGRDREHYSFDVVELITE